MTDNEYLIGNNIHSASLYQLYRKAGLIRAEEAEGGSHIEFKAGLVFDNREHEADPTRGIWAEVYAYGSPAIFHRRNNYLKLAAHFRQYLPLWRDKIVFAYHLAYQGTIAGEAPYYTLQNISTLYLRQIASDGLGSINTVRGTRLNRVVGDGYAWANFEMRFKLWSFKFIKQNWYIATNPFFDMGACIQPYRLAEMQQVARTQTSLDGATRLTPEEVALIYRGDAEKLHMSAGLGLKLAMNRNFILSAEFAFPFNHASDGKFGTNIGLNYIF
jgi:outer membrane protein assembly factor BamA